MSAARRPVIGFEAVGQLVATPRTNRLPSLAGQDGSGGAGGACRHGRSALDTLTPAHIDYGVYRSYRVSYSRRHAGQRHPLYFARISARASSVSETLLHQHPERDSSHSNGCPHDSQVPGFLISGPAAPHSSVGMSVVSQAYQSAKRIAGSRFKGFKGSVLGSRVRLWVQGFGCGFKGSVVGSRGWLDRAVWDDGRSSARPAALAGRRDCGSRR